MFDMINELIDYFGLSVMPETFGEFLPWFVAVLIGIEFVLFIFDSVFYTIRQLSRGCK